MKKSIVASFIKRVPFLAVLLSVTMAYAENPNAQQLSQLASEISGYVVGTADGTFSACTYENGMLTFTVNDGSRFNKQYQASDFDQQNEMLEAAVLKMLSGEPGVAILTFLEQTRTSICWRLPLQGGNGQYAEVTMWPGDLKAKLIKQNTGK